MKNCNYGEILKVPVCLIQVNGTQENENSFAKERDNILYSSAFRNLSAKTQVFHSDIRGNIRTRLTHTLEVARLAVNIAGTLGFDCELTEAIALGHDLGHTPFGHVGERVIHRFSTGDDKKYATKDGQKQEISYKMKGFKHNHQSVRLLVDYTAGEFSNFVLYGIRGHSSLVYKKLGDNGKTPFYDKYEKFCSVILDDESMIPAWSIEAFIVKWADEIAQRHHDVEDAFFQKIMTPTRIVEIFEDLSNLSQDKQMQKVYLLLKGIASSQEVLGDEEIELFSHCLTEFVIGTYVSESIIEFGNNISNIIREYNIKDNHDFEEKYCTIREQDVQKLMSLENTAIGMCDKALGHALKYAILDSYEVQRMDGRSEYVIRRLLRAYKSNPQQLPDRYINRLLKEEIDNFLTENELNIILNTIKKNLGYDVEHVKRRLWPTYECRNALRVLLEEYDSEIIIFHVMMRIVFDYVASMTDSIAYEEYRELYE